MREKEQQEKLQTRERNTEPISRNFTPRIYRADERPDALTQRTLPLVHHRLQRIAIHFRGVRLWLGRAARTHSPARVTPIIVAISTPRCCMHGLKNAKYMNQGMNQRMKEWKKHEDEKEKMHTFITRGRVSY